MTGVDLGTIYIQHEIAWTGRNDGVQLQVKITHLDLLVDV